MELIMASCVCGYHMYSENWIAAPGEELYCERVIRNVIDRHAVAVKLTMRFAAAMARDGIELENVPLGLSKALLCVLKYKEDKVKLHEAYLIMRQKSNEWKIQRDKSFTTINVLQ